MVKYLDQWQLPKVPAAKQHELVRSYALLVGLNPSDFSPYLAEEERQTPQLRSIVTLSRTSGSLLTFLALFTIGGFLVWRVLLAVAVPNLSVDQPAQGQSIVQPVVMVSGRASEQAQVFINGVSVPQEPNGSFSTEVVLSLGANTISVVAINSFGRLATTSRTVIYQSDSP